MVILHKNNIRKLYKIEKLAWEISLLLFYLDRYTGILYSKGRHKLYISYLQLRIPVKMNMDVRWHTKEKSDEKVQKKKLKLKRQRQKQRPRHR